MFKIQQNETSYGKSVTVTERVFFGFCLKFNSMTTLQ